MFNFRSFNSDLNCQLSVQLPATKQNSLLMHHFLLRLLKLPFAGHSPLHSSFVAKWFVFKKDKWFHSREPIVSSVEDHYTVLYSWIVCLLLPAELWSSLQCFYFFKHCWLSAAARNSAAVGKMTTEAYEAQEIFIHII